MRHRWVIGWLELSTGGRLMSFSGGAVLLTLLLWYAWWRPVQLEQQRLEQQHRQHIARYQQQLRSLPAYPSLVDLQQQTAQLQKQRLPSVPVMFSLPAMLNASGATLEYWHPVEKGGELALHLEWSHFIALLNYLSGLQPALMIPRFSLQREAQRLRLVMELSNED